LHFDWTIKHKNNWLLLLWCEFKKSSTNASRTTNSLFSYNYACACATPKKRNQIPVDV